MIFNVNIARYSITACLIVKLRFENSNFFPCCKNAASADPPTSSVVPTF